MKIMLSSARRSIKLEDTDFRPMPAGHILSRRLAGSDVTPAWLAQATGLDGPIVCALLAGEERLSADAAFRIGRALSLHNTGKENPELGNLFLRVQETQEFHANWGFMPGASLPTIARALFRKLNKKGGPQPA